MTKFIESEDGYYVESPEFVKEQINKKFDLFLRLSEIPSFYHQISFDDYAGDKSSEAFRKITHYASHCREEKFNHVSLYLWGLHSTQKTALACNIGKEAMRNGLRVKFILAGDLISKFIKIQGFSTDIEIKHEIEELKEFDMIIIDDCWDEDKSLYWKNSTNLIIAEWDIFLRTILSKGVKVIMTSNYSMDIVAQKYGLSLFELLDRNFVCIQLTESVKQIRKLSVSDAFKDIK